MKRNLVSIFSILLILAAGCAHAPKPEETVVAPPLKVEEALVPLAKVEKGKAESLPLSVKQGSVVFMSEPSGAEVFLSDIPMGIAPLTIKDVPAATYTVRMELEHYETWRGSVQVKHQETSEVHAELVGKPGTLKVQSHPSGADVWVDGQTVGITPYSGWIFPGEEHVVIVTTEGYGWVEGKVTVQPEGSEAISLVLEKVKEGEELPLTIIGKDGAEMVLIPAGWFIMGSPEGEGNDDEHPQRNVYLDAYYIDRYEVTNEQFEKFINATGYQAQGDWWRYYTEEKEKHPVVYVTWNDADAYARWAGKRLPTEAEWEKAARGTSGRKWPWGSVWDASRCSSEEAGPATTTPVGSYPDGASPYGVMDIAGNVWEWCADWYGKNYYQSAVDRNPTGPSSGSRHVLRGGSWFFISSYMRCATRSYFPLNLMDCDTGFRCVRTP